MGENMQAYICVYIYVYIYTYIFTYPSFRIDTIMCGSRLRHGINCIMEARPSSHPDAVAFSIRPLVTMITTIRLDAGVDVVVHDERAVEAIAVLMTLLQVL